MKSKYILVFLFGFFSCLFVLSVFNYSNVRVPFGTGLVSLNLDAPFGRISEDNITVLSDKVILKIPDAKLSDYVDSGSMKPVLDKGTKGIQIVPSSEDDVRVGDIVTYRFGGVLIVHRVVEKGVDGKGVYFITKGDNNLIRDVKIRFKDIEFVTVAILY